MPGIRLPEGDADIDKDVEAPNPLSLVRKASNMSAAGEVDFLLRLLQH